jgi:hypothetical protein
MDGIAETPWPGRPISSLDLAKASERAADKSVGSAERQEAL